MRLNLFILKTSMLSTGSIFNSLYVCGFWPSFVRQIKPLESAEIKLISSWS